LDETVAHNNFGDTPMVDERQTENKWSKIAQKFLCKNHS